MQFLRGYPRVLAGAALVALAMLATACSQGSDDEDGEVCNELVNDGPAVSATSVAATAPTPTGGTITDGVYELIALTAYSRPGGSTTAPSGVYSAVFAIMGDTIQQVGVIDCELRR